jgi:GGDEF domain-containing protein
MIPYHNGKPGVGNKLAFETFIQKMKPGYYVSMDGNDLKTINRISHIAGDLAIKSIGNALRNASLQITNSKLFRSGGDEYLLYCEQKENTFLFVERALKEFDQLKIIYHNTTLGDTQENIYEFILTLSFGIGITYADAENALSEAKRKKTHVRSNLMHSNVL